MTISFIIPMRNSEGTIKRTIDSIKNQKTSQEFEIIAVDNSSTDQSVQICKDAGVQVITEPLIGRSYARNRGWRYSKSDWICFIDSDVELELNWLEILCPYLRSDFFDVLQGKIYPKSTKADFFSSYRKDNIRYQTQGTFCHLDSGQFLNPSLNTATCIVRRAHLELIKGFDNELVTYEDIDLSWRLWYRGARFTVCPNLISYVYFSKKQRLLSYLKRSFEMGEGYFHLLNKWQYHWGIILNKSNFFRETSSFSFKLYYLFNQIFFFSAYHFQLAFSKKRNDFKPIGKSNKEVSLFETEEQIVLLSPAFRFIKTSKLVVFKNIKSNYVLTLSCLDEHLDESLMASLLIENRDIFGDKIIITDK